MRFSSIIVLFITLSCSGNTELLSGFNKSDWQEDKMGCNGRRNQIIDELMARKVEITGLGQEDITAVLGKADMHELYSRNKKSFTYFLASGPDCQTSVASPPKLIIRFDGLGRSKDIIHYK